MQIDLDHLHHWMQAIRKSPDPIRTLDAFWKGQLTSKKWLIEKLRPFVFKEFGTKSVDIDIHGGWVGVLASMLFQSDIPVKQIRSIDIDPMCESIAFEMNRIEEMQGKFTAITEDMCHLFSKSDIIINTSCEHINQIQYDAWLSHIPNTSILVLQSNNYQIPEHVRTANDLDHFKQQCHINTIWSGELDLPLYKRFMIIGKNNVSSEN